MYFSSVFWDSHILSCATDVQCAWIRIFPLDGAGNRFPSVLVMEMIKFKLSYHLSYAPVVVGFVGIYDFMGTIKNSQSRYTGMPAFE